MEIIAGIAIGIVVMLAVFWLSLVAVYFFGLWLAGRGDK